MIGWLLIVLCFLQNVVVCRIELRFLFSKNLFGYGRKEEMAKEILPVTTTISFISFVVLFLFSTIAIFITN